MSWEEHDLWKQTELTQFKFWSIQLPWEIYIAILNLSLLICKMKVIFTSFCCCEGNRCDNTWKHLDYLDIKALKTGQSFSFSFYSSTPLSVSSTKPRKSRLQISFYTHPPSPSSSQPLVSYKITWKV